MFFKNLLVYKLPDHWSISMGELERLLEKHPLQPPSNASVKSMGWVPSGPEGQFVCAYERNLLIAFGIAKRVLPGPVVKDEVARLAAELEKQQGFPPGKKQLRDLKEQAFNALLPRAFIQRSQLRAWIDMKAGTIAVETTAPSKAEELITVLRSLLNDEFPVTVFDTKLSPADAMTMWLQTSSIPHPFAVTDGGELVGGDVSKPTVRYVHHELEGRADVLKHIQEGKKVTKLALNWSSKVEFTLTDKMQISKLKFFVDPERDDASFHADFVLMCEEYRQLIRDLLATMGTTDAATVHDDRENDGEDALRAAA